MITALDSLCHSALRHLRSVDFTQKPILYVLPIYEAQQMEKLPPVVAGVQERKTGRDNLNLIKLYSNAWSFECA